MVIGQSRRIPGEWGLFAYISVESTGRREGLRPRPAITSDVVMFEDGALICTYEGPEIPDVDLNQPEIIANRYVWAIDDRGTAIDASDPLSCYGRYANDGFDDNNACIDTRRGVTGIYPKIIIQKFSWLHSFSITIPNQ